MIELNVAVVDVDGDVVAAVAAADGGVDEDVIAAAADDDLVVEFVVYLIATALDLYCL